MRLALALALSLQLMSCMPAPVAKANLRPASAPPAGWNSGSTYWWCAAGELADGTGVMMCADDYDTCSSERTRALRYGGLVNLTKIGECVQVVVGLP